MSKISELSDGGSLVSSDYLIAVRSGGNVKVRMDQINVDQVDLGDNEFIRLGNSQDLTMVHTSTQSIINQAGIGDLLLQKAGATKLTINATGIDVTGTVTADGLTVDGNASLGNTSVNQLNISGLTKITGVRGTFVDPSEDSSIPNIFATNDAVGDFSREAGHLVIQPRVHPTVFRDVVFAGGAGTTKRLMTIQGEGNLSLYEDTGTTPKFFWDSSAESLGIGTSSPLTSLWLQDSATQKATFANADFVANSAGSTFDISMGATTGSTYTSLRALTTGRNAWGNLVLQEGGGNVGIGTSSPNTTLTLSDGTDEFDFGVTANQLMIKSVTSDGFDDQRIIIDAGSGGQSSARGAYIALSGNEASTEAGKTIYQMGNVTGSSHVFRKAGGNDAVTIDSSGMLLVGTSSVLFSNRSLQVKANGGNDAAVIQSTAVSAKTLLCWNNVTSGDNQFIAFLTEAGGTQRGVIDYNRAAGQVRYNITSDARLKDNIQNAEESGSLIDSIQVRQYDLKETSHHVGFGFIAQELLEVAPEAVHQPEDPEEMMGVDYSKLVPMMLKEIQSLRARIAALES